MRICAALLSMKNTDSDTNLTGSGTVYCFRGPFESDNSADLKRILQGRISRIMGNPTPFTFRHVALIMFQLLWWTLILRGRHARVNRLVSVDVISECVFFQLRLELLIGGRRRGWAKQMVRAAEQEECEWLQMIGVNNLKSLTLWVNRIEENARESFTISSYISSGLHPVYSHQRAEIVPSSL